MFAMMMMMMVMVTIMMIMTGTSSTTIMNSGWDDFRSEYEAKKPRIDVG